MFESRAVIFLLILFVYLAFAYFECILGPIEQLDYFGEGVHSGGGELVGK